MHAITLITQVNNDITKKNFKHFIKNKITFS